MRSFGILRRVERQILIDVSEQPIGPKFKDQTVHPGRLDLGRWKRLRCSETSYVTANVQCIKCQKDEDSM